MEDEKQKAPFHKRKVKAACAAHDESALLLQVLGIEKVAGAHKEGRYRNHVGEAGQVGGGCCMSRHDEEDGKCL